MSQWPALKVLIGSKDDVRFTLRPVHTNIYPVCASQTNTHALKGERRPPVKLGDESSPLPLSAHSHCNNDFGAHRRNPSTASHTQWSAAKGSGRSYMYAPG